jgi:hypothetical protein
VAGKRLYKETDSQVFYQSLPDGSYNLALFNTGSSTQNVSVKWEDFGIKGSAFVRDLWNHQDLGSMETGFTANLSTHASRMVHVVPASSLTVSPKSGASEVNPTDVTFKWSAQSGAESYHVQIATDSSMKNIVFDQNVSIPTANVKELDKDTRYYWKVSSVSGGKETKVGIYSFHTEVTTAPAKPSGMMATRNNKDSVSLTWNPSLGATSYTVYRKKVNGFGVSSDYAPIAENLTATNFMDKTAKRHTGSTYSYIVTANNTIGESAKSFEAKTDQQSPAQVAALIVFLSLLIFSKLFTIARDRFKGSKSSIPQRTVA